MKEVRAEIIKRKELYVDGEPVNSSSVVEPEILSALTGEEKSAVDENSQVSLFFEEDIKAGVGDDVRLRKTLKSISKVQVNDLLLRRTGKVLTDLKQIEAENGPVGGAWSFVKNTCRFGANSETVRKLHQKESELITVQGFEKSFFQLTGNEYSQENMKLFLEGEILLNSEKALRDYKEGQNSAVDIFADVVSGLSALGAFVAIATTSPLSLLLAGGAALLTGGLGKAFVKGLDSAIGGREYKSFREDVITGAFSGLIGLVAGVCGGAAGSKLAARLGVRSAGRFRGGRGLLNILKNPTGNKYYGGSAAKRTLSKVTEMMTDGSVGGGLDNGFRSFYQGDDAKKILKTVGQGFVYGLAFSPIIGGGMEAIGRSVKHLTEPTLITGGEYLPAVVHVPLEEKLSAVFEIKTWQKLLSKSRSQILTADDVRDILSEDFIEKNYLTKYVNDVIKTTQPDEHVLDLASPLAAKDYEMIAGFVNKQDGEYLDKWLKIEGGVDNMQKLAQFVRVQQLTGKQRLYFGMGDAEWSVVVDGVTDRPEEVAKHFFAYKKDSKEINGAITKSLYEVTPKLQDAIDGITNFIEKHPIKEPIKVYRGEGHYGIFSGNKTSYGKDLAEELERIAKDFSEAKVDYTYIQKFIYNELRNRVIIQSRFLSTAMDKSCADMYAKVAEWKLDVPTGTKGLQIESYNVERKAEDEFLIQRGSKIQIEDAYFDQYQKIWMLKGIVKQD